MSRSTIGCYYYHKGLDWDPQDPNVQQWQRKFNEITVELINGVMHVEWYSTPLLFMML